MILNLNNKTTLNYKKILVYKIVKKPFQYNLEVIKDPILMGI
jgi:hypothetical protein